MREGEQVVVGIEGGEREGNAKSLKQTRLFADAARDGRLSAKSKNGKPSSDSLTSPARCCPV